MLLSMAKSHPPRAFPCSSCSQGEALLTRAERCRQRRDAALPAPLCSCPAPRWGRESRRQESEERNTEKHCLTHGGYLGSGLRNGYNTEGSRLRVFPLLESLRNFPGFPLDFYVT